MFTLMRGKWVRWGGMGCGMVLYVNLHGDSCRVGVGVEWSMNIQWEIEFILSFPFSPHPYSKTNGTSFCISAPTDHHDPHDSPWGLGESPEENSTHPVEFGSLPPTKSQRTRRSNTTKERVWTIPYELWGKAGILKYACEWTRAWGQTDAGGRSDAWIDESVWTHWYEFVWINTRGRDIQMKKKHSVRRKIKTKNNSFFSLSFNFSLFSGLSYLCSSENTDHLKSDVEIWTLFWVGSWWIPVPYCWVRVLFCHPTLSLSLSILALSIHPRRENRAGETDQMREKSAQNAYASTQDRSVQTDHLQEIVQNLKIKKDNRK